MQQSLPPDSEAERVYTKNLRGVVASGFPLAPLRADVAPEPPSKKLQEPPSKKLKPIQWLKERGATLKESHPQGKGIREDEVKKHVEVTLDIIQKGLLPEGTGLH